MSAHPADPGAGATPRKPLTQVGLAELRARGEIDQAQAIRSAGAFLDEQEERTGNDQTTAARILQAGRRGDRGSPATSFALTLIGKNSGVRRPRW